MVRCAVLTKQLPSLVLSMAMARTWKGTGGCVGLGQDPRALQLVSGEGTSLPVPQLYQVQLACVSKSTGSTMNKSWVLALPILSCVTLRFKFQFSHL